MNLRCFSDLAGMVDLLERIPDRLNHRQLALQGQIRVSVRVANR